MKFPGQGEAVSSRELFLDDGSLHGATGHYAAKLGGLPQGRAGMPCAEIAQKFSYYLKACSDTAQCPLLVHARVHKRRQAALQRAASCDLMHTAPLPLAEVTATAFECGVR